MKRNSKMNRSSIPMKYTIFIILSLQITRIPEVLSANQYITDYKCHDYGPTFICSDEAEKDISTKIQSSDMFDLCSSSMHFVPKRSRSVTVHFADDCELSKLPPQLLSNTEVSKLDASNISLETLTGNEFASIGSPTSINLSSYRLKYMDQPVFKSQTGLKTLDLSNNQIQLLGLDAFNGLIELNELHLQFNNLSEISNGTFIGLNELLILDLSHNRLRWLDADTFSDLINVWWLHLQGNELSEISNGTFIGLRKLTTLDLSHNRLRQLSVDISELSSLASLYLQYNNISALSSRSFEGLRRLNSLDLSFNNITKLEAGYFMHSPYLHYLNVSHSQLTYVETGAFTPLKFLDTLNLSNNRLTQLDFNQFLPSAKRLEILHLDGNQLTKLHDRFDKLFPRLKSLKLTNNQFDCSYLGKFVSTLYSTLKAIDTTSITHSPNIIGITCVMNDAKHVDVEHSKSTTKYSESAAFDQ